MDCQGIEIKKRENKTEIIINKNDEYTTSLFILFIKMRRNIFT